MILRPASEARFDVNEPIDGATEIKRKGPQASHRGTSERIDWAYFNKDLGDLTDPYETRRIRANSGNKATAPKRY
jgi:hypothetical protein